MISPDKFVEKRGGSSLHGRSIKKGRNAYIYIYVDKSQGCRDPFKKKLGF